MDYEIESSTLFYEQLDELSKDAVRIIKNRLELARHNPGRNKRVKGYNLNLFSIRFRDQKIEKRVIYLVDGLKILCLFILNRKNDYKDLDKYLRMSGLI